MLQAQEDTEETVLISDSESNKVTEFIQVDKDSLVANKR